MTVNAIALEIPPAVAYVRVLTAGAEAVAKTSGLAGRESGRLQLAVEELFTCLIPVAEPMQSVHVRLEGLRHQALAVFDVAAENLALGGLNIHSAASLDHREEYDPRLGLFLATRMVDRFHIDRDGERFTVRIEVDKAYPPSPDVQPARRLSAPFVVERCEDTAVNTLLAALAYGAYPPWLCPASFAGCGMFADMVADGQVFCLAATDKAGNPAGFVCWRESGVKAIDFAGPFVFGTEKALAALALTDRFLESVARSGREIVFSLRPTADLPSGYFEPLGELATLREGRWQPQTAVFRQLQEDSGAMVWAHPAMRPFLDAFYDRLALSREIAAAARQVHPAQAQSVLSVQADVRRNMAVIRPLMDGSDLGDNLACTLAALGSKGIGDMRVNLDLGVAWQAALAGVLEHAGLRLRIALPQAGRSDIAVYQTCAP